jgi:hypothetical protein
VLSIARAERCGVSPNDQRIAIGEQSAAQKLPEREHGFRCRHRRRQGGAGLASTILLKQVAPDTRVVIVEKGSEVGTHILSGIIADPIGLDRLLPEWRKEPDRPIVVEVTEDSGKRLSHGACAIRGRLAVGAQARTTRRSSMSISCCRTWQPPRSATQNL